VLVESLRLAAQHVRATALEGLTALLEAARPAVGCSEAGLLVPGPTLDMLRFLTTASSSPEINATVLQQVIPIDHSIAGYVYMTGHLVARTNPAASESAHFYEAVDRATGLVTHHYLAAPIFDEGRILGVATFLNRPPDRPDEPFGPAEIERAEAICRLLAVGLEHHRQVAWIESWRDTELDRVAAELAPVADEDGVSSGFDAPLGTSSRPPLLRVLALLERMPADQQELAYELVECLARHRSPG
jgi:GAF domain-containing protein